MPSSASSSSSPPSLPSATAFASMKVPFASFHRSSSEPAIASSAALSPVLAEERPRHVGIIPHQGFPRQRLHLRSLGFSPGRGNTPQTGGTATSTVAPSAQSLSAVTARIHDPSACLFSVIGCGRAPTAAAMSPPESLPTNHIDGCWAPESPTRVAEEGGPRVETTFPSLRTKSLRESESVPVHPAPVDVTAPAAAATITATGDKKSTTKSAAPVDVTESTAADAITAAREKKGAAKSTAALSTGAAEEKEYVWADMYRPSVLNEFICNRAQAMELHQMVTANQCNHLIFEGHPGVGKKTMVLATLRDTFGPENLKMKTELKKFELKGEFVTSIEVNVRESSRHIEVNLSDLHGYEKHVLVALMNDYHIPSDKHGCCDHRNRKVVVLHEADKLSTDTQHYVSWLMEKYKGCNKMVFCCSDAAKLQIIKPLCKVISLDPPSINEIIEVLEFIARQESIDLPSHMAKRFADNSKNNLRQAIRSFEASWKSNYSVKENQDILTGWEDDIANIAKSIIEEQSPKQLYIIRGKLKNLIEYDVSPDFIFSTLVAELKKHLDDQLQAKIDDLYREYKSWGNCYSTDDPKTNVRRFMRIEEFTAKFMSIYKSFITKKEAGV